jgi:hypothetical protein
VLLPASIVSYVLKTCVTLEEGLLNLFCVPQTESSRQTYASTMWLALRVLAGCAVVTLALMQMRAEGSRVVSKPSLTMCALHWSGKHSTCRFHAFRICVCVPRGPMRELGRSIKCSC